MLCCVQNEGEAKMIHFTLNKMEKNMNDESSVFVRACCVFPSLFGGKSVSKHVSLHLQVANNASCWTFAAQMSNWLQICSQSPNSVANDLLLVFRCVVAGTHKKLSGPRGLEVDTVWPNPKVHSCESTNIFLKTWSAAILRVQKLNSNL